MASRIKLLMLITILAAFFRFWDLGKLPQSLNWDEVAIGWNAYSILQTGKDEYGTFLPTTFRSFEDYKSPLYVYLTIPWIMVFGKTEFAVRGTSALLGTLTIPMLALLTYWLLRKKSASSTDSAIWNPRIFNIGIMSGFLLAITPWHIHFSRVAFEANIGLFFLCTGTFTYLKWLYNSAQRKWLLIAVIMYACAIHSYANMRLLVPLIILLISCNHLYTIRVHLKTYFLAAAMGIVLVSPLVIEVIRGEGLARYEATALINRPNVYDQVRDRRINESNPILAKLFYSDDIALLRAFTESYLSHFSYQFLFVQNEPSRVNIPGNGLLYIWMLPLIFIGIGGTIYWHRKIQWIYILGLIFISPIPAGLTWDTPNAIRTELLVIPLTMFSAIGLWIVLKYIQRQDLKNYVTTTAKEHRLKSILYWIWPKTAALTITIIVGISVIRFWHNYRTHLNLEFANTWLFGRKEMVERVNAIKPEFNQVKVSLKLDWAYLWFLWYGDIKPEVYLKEGGTRGGKFDFEGNRIENISFRNFDYSQESFNSSGTLYVGTPEDFPKDFAPGLTIETSEGQKVIFIVRS